MDQPSRLECSRCGASIQRATADRTSGKCMPCHTGARVLSEPLVWEWWRVDQPEDAKRIASVRKLVEELAEAEPSVKERVELSLSDPLRYWRQYGRSELIERPQQIQPFWVFVEAGSESGLLGSVDWRAEPDDVFQELLRCSGDFSESATRLQVLIEEENFVAGASAVDVLRRCQHYLPPAIRLLHLHIDWDSYEFIVCRSDQASTLESIRDPEYQITSAFDDH
jgi:hypothetical protein